MISRTIAISKVKLAGTLMSSLILVLLSASIIWFNLSTHIIVKAVSYLGFALFSLIFCFGLKRLFSRNAGLIIDEQGITDYSNAAAVGFVPWSDIMGFEEQQFMSNKFILVYVYQPELYVDGRSTAHRMVLQDKWDQWGTPIALSAQLLSCSRKELLQYLVEGLASYNQLKISNPT